VSGRVFVERQPVAFGARRATMVGETVSRRVVCVCVCQCQMRRAGVDLG